MLNLRLVLAGWNGIEQWKCEGMGCCYSPEPGKINNVTDGMPTCYKANGGAAGYSVNASALQTGGASDECWIHALFWS